ncbi:competence protein ComEC [Ruaniaceae bacterium KH17]|nr:competence protein ComEC [Ruaniaceae bacterium KH17]
MNADFRLVPAAAAAWLMAALAVHLPGVAQGVLVAVAAIAVGLAVVKGRVPLVLAGAVAAGVVLSAAVQASQMVLCDGAVVVHGRAAGNGEQTALGAMSPARMSLRVDAVACASGPAQWGSGTVVLLGEVDGVLRDTIVSARGRMVELERGGSAYALVMDAELLSVESAGGLVGLVSGRRADFLGMTAELSPQAQGLVPGMTFGDDSALTDVLDQAMKRTSLSHLTAISGSHITMMLAVILVLTVHLSVRWRAALLLLAIGALLLLVGPDASVVRATAMATVGAVALWRGRPPQAIPALATGIVVLMILDPWRATSLGFALSVSASAALVLVVPRLALRVPEKKVWLRRVVAVCAVPLVAQLACAPIILLFSPAVSLSSVLANVLVTPAVPLATGAGMLALLTTQWEGVVCVLLRIAEAGTWWIAEVAMDVSRLPGASVPWFGGAIGALLLGTVNVAILAVLAGPPRVRGRHAKEPPRRSPNLGIVLGPAATRSRGVFHGPANNTQIRPPKLKSWLIAGAFTGLIAVGIVALRPEPWVVYQCDVGQGSATLIRAGPSSAVMIDVGLAEGRSQDCLSRARVSQLDLLVLTHPHADHVGNLPAVLSAVPVREAIVSPARTSVAERLEREFDAVGVTPWTGLTGLSGSASAATWTVLWPDRAREVQDDGVEGAGVNDASVVLLVESGGARIVALGDVEELGQVGLVEVVQRCGKPCQDVDVVIVAHHGSKTQSAELTRLLSPEVAIIGVGENRYGHPTPEAIELYEAVGAVVLRTDRDGDIRVGNVRGP